MNGEAPQVRCLGPGLSTSSSIVSVEDTGHRTEVDQPQLVVDELLQLLP